MVVSHCRRTVIRSKIYAVFVLQCYIFILIFRFLTEKNEKEEERRDKVKKKIGKNAMR